MVMAHIPAKTRWVKKSSQPKASIQIILPIPPKIPKLPISTSFPKGDRTSQAILKHWRPNGIPITVTQRIKPAMVHKTEAISPPKIIQNKFPIRLIISPLNIIFIITIFNLRINVNIINGFLMEF